MLELISSKQELITCTKRRVQHLTTDKNFSFNCAMTNSFAFFLGKDML